MPRSPADRLNALLDELDGLARQDDEAGILGGSAEYHSTRDAVFTLVDDHPELADDARSYGLPV